MSKVRIKLNSSGIRELLHSPEITSTLVEIGQGVAGRAGANFGVKSFSMPTRSVVRVSAINKKGVKENLDSNVLLKSLH